MTTKGEPRVNLPYRLPRKPTANEPMADEMSARLGNALPEKKLDTKPGRGARRARGQCALDASRADEGNESDAPAEPTRIMTGVSLRKSGWPRSEERR